MSQQKLQNIPAFVSGDYILFWYAKEECYIVQPIEVDWTAEYMYECYEIPQDNDALWKPKHPEEWLAAMEQYLVFDEKYNCWRNKCTEEL